LRHQFETMGVEEMGKKELQLCANRFVQAKRIGSFQHRDDRAANQFFIAQVFEINRFLGVFANRKQCQFKIPSYWITNALLMPEKKERRTPFVLPYPFHITHIIDIESPAITSAFRQLIRPRASLQNQFVQFNRTNKIGYGYWMTNFSLNVIADSVPADQVEKHREFVEQVWRESLWHLNLAAGYSRPRQKRGFGELPIPSTKNISTNKSDAVEPQVATGQRTITEFKEAVISNHDNKPASQSLPRKTASPSQPQRRHRHIPNDKSKIPLWLIIIGAVFGIFLLIVIFAMLENSRR
jgi:hypothetical protein